jgi:hypothetical protein
MLMMVAPYPKQGFSYFYSKARIWRFAAIFCPVADISPISVDVLPPMADANGVQAIAAILEIDHIVVH